MDYAIETVALTKVFSDWWGRAKVYAVDDLNLQIRPNEVFGLLGPNGSGKTTTIKMLLGLLHPTRGHALILGGDGTHPKISARVGFLPEESYLYRFLNARETLDFYGRLFGLDSRTREMRTEALLEMVGLKAVASRPVGTYSKGMARRIGLAQALINDPDLLILDEPTTGLDPIGTRQIKDLIMKLAERGKTVLLCSHLLADVEDVCDRIAILYGGKVQAHGRVKDLLQKTNKRQILTSAISDGTADRIRRILQEEHADCEISSPMERLETFFINTVVEAQQQATPTSGAVSTTQIGEFLTAGARQGDILDKLVAAPVVERAEAGPVRTERPQPHEAVVPEPNKDLLAKLTRSASSSKVEPVGPGRTQPAVPTPETTVHQEQVRKNILDELTGKKHPDGSTVKPSEGPGEDGGHA
ncbi:MAG TPA: ATP-binding cassette domain-containing protein [Sedimentisphaerales bacterium]|jgi:ABC-2 type transport system ATP-binding protein|nr:ATP-binding cassette domain-containing protein [Sedimentisphaerales bacterium]HNU31532.1 ATP-binding cassette domain-containing protein [Sedimentisphaerales bacterium]